jgi:hypothetical protein
MAEQQISKLGDRRYRSKGATPPIVHRPLKDFKKFKEREKPKQER